LTASALAGLAAPACRFNGAEVRRNSYVRAVARAVVGEAVEVPQLPSGMPSSGRCTNASAARARARSGRDPRLDPGVAAPLDRPTWLAAGRGSVPDRAIVGTPSEVTDIVGRYQDAGAVELVVPDSTLGDVSEAKQTCDLFMEQVAVHFRP
jgi:alkanesulfonate monooxygenase SsuD/methylene tetrahydromethanopterin reductase-like flavin-dependent oxidoreductase (luciferase family)